MPRGSSEHLDTCGACRGAAAEYDDQRMALRRLRDDAPQPPRDLWARTAAAIEAEGAGAGPGRSPTAVLRAAGVRGRELSRSRR